MIPEAVIEQIRDRIDVVAVIGRHMELRRSGRTWKGNCPFHGERTPSFHVYPEDKHYKCYGCGAYGNVFTFLQQLKGKEFPEVVRELAAEVGIEIPESSGEDSAEAQQRRKERNEILAACEAAARYFAARLSSAHEQAAQKYLEGRGVSAESVKRFQLGVSADAWSDLAGRLRAKGLAQEALLRAGLLIPSDKRREPYDRFRGRLMFPIAGMDGKIIGFGGRALKDDSGAKYINSPETLLYKKSRVLYGLDLAKESIRKTRSAVLVEGYFDVIGLVQAGITNAVAVCGTALTPEHVELLTRCDCREVTILFDGDSAGLAAPAKAAAALFPAGMAGKVAILPSAGQDPDDYARANGRAGVETLLKSAVSLSTFLVERAVDRACGERPGEASLEAKLKAVRELASYVRMMPEGLARSVFEDTIAKRLDLDREALRAELAGEGFRPASSRAPAAANSAPARAWAPAPPRPVPVRVHSVLPGPAADALGLLMAFPDLGPVAEEVMLASFLPAGPLADLARDLVSGKVAPAEAILRVESGGNLAVLRRVKDLTGPGRPDAKDAERELRRAVLKASIEAVRQEHETLLALVAKRGDPVPENLSIDVQIAARKKSDLEKRLRALERGA